MLANFPVVQKLNLIKNKRMSKGKISILLHLSRKKKLLKFDWMSDLIY